MARNASEPEGKAPVENPHLGLQVPPHRASVGSDVQFCTQRRLHAELPSSNYHYSRADEFVSFCINQRICCQHRCSVGCTRCSAKG